jgi:glycosyltransferase involved in cell wall biosynthesis
MKLLYLHQYFTFPQYSGGTRSYDLSKEFVKKGIDVTIITSNAKMPDLDMNKRWTYLEQEGVKLWILRCKYNHKMSIFRRILSFFEFVYFTSVKVVRLESDLMLATSTPLTIAIPAIIKKKISKTPYVFEVRDVWPEGPIQQGYVKNKFIISILRGIEKYIYKGASYVVPLSVGMKRDILSRVFIDRIEVIPNISEILRFEDLSNKVDLDFDYKGKRIILYAGTLGPVNDIMYIAKLASATLVKEPSIVYLIIGDGKQKKQIVEYCKKNNTLNKNIFFMDPISKNALPYVYHLATMGSSFVWNYKIKWDNSANKFFDTLAAGRPVLINYQGWQADVIREKECGFVLPYEPTDIEIQQFVDFVINDELVRKSGENAKVAAEDYSLDVAVRKYVNIFSDVLLK